MNEMELKLVEQLLDEQRAQITSLEKDNEHLREHLWRAAEVLEEHGL